MKLLKHARCVFEAADAGRLRFPAGDLGALYSGGFLVSRIRGAGQGKVVGPCTVSKAFLHFSQSLTYFLSIIIIIYVILRIWEKETLPLCMVNLEFVGTFVSTFDLRTICVNFIVR